MDELQIVVDRDLCLGAQTCVHVAPGMFEIDDEGLSRVVNADPSRLADALDAARQCPSGAISVAEPHRETG
jgi:ferredoxin